MRSRPFSGIYSQYGFEFHFGHFSRLSDTIVFNRHDGCIWGRFDHDAYPPNCAIPAIYQRNQKIRADHDAFRLCQELNGNPIANVSGIDSTP